MLHIEFVNVPFAHRVTEFLISPLHRRAATPRSVLSVLKARDFPETERPRHFSEPETPGRSYTHVGEGGGGGDARSQRAE